MKKNALILTFSIALAAIAGGCINQAHIASASSGTGAYCASRYEADHESENACFAGINLGVDAATRYREYDDHSLSETLTRVEGYCYVQYDVETPEAAACIAGLFEFKRRLEVEIRRDAARSRPAAGGSISATRNDFSRSYSPQIRD